MAVSARRVSLPSPSPGPDAVVAGLAAARRRTLELVATLSDEELTRVHSPLMSPLVWDLGHIAAYEDLWLVHRHAGRELLHPELAELYDAFETPRAVRGQIEMLDRARAHEYLEQVRERTLDAIVRLGVGDGLVHEMVIQHEYQHNETMLQTLGLARLDGHRPPGIGAVAVGGPGPVLSGLETVVVPGGAFELGAPAGRFSFDNERPRHPASLPAFAIGRVPVTNASWLSFAEGGGYERREWWSDEGWAWKEEYDISRPGGWTTDLPETRRPPVLTAGGAPSLKGQPVFEWRVGGHVPLDPQGPALHVSWFEADAFARAHGLRLPTEAEWEKAATWDQQTGQTLEWPWGSRDRRSQHANLFESGAWGTTAVGSRPSGAAPCGALDMIGNVWEWTSSPFGGYPGFVAHPYREYSEVFFGEDHRVLRGGSWATSQRVISPSFRNWDLPQRRQIFSGVRIAAAA